MSASLASRLAEAGMSRREAARKAVLFARAEETLAGGKSMRSGAVWRWLVPGRIEVFGKHTDYAGGRSLVCPLERGFCIAAAPRDDAILRVTDAVSGVSTEIQLAKEDTSGSADWTVYPRTVARRVARDFPGPLAGADIALASDLPRAAGLSSSSALIVAVFTALAARNRLAEHPVWREALAGCTQLAGYLGAVEGGREFGRLVGGAGVGTFGGSEDHAAILCGQAGHVSLFSFCPVRLEEAIRLPEELTFVVGVSGVAAEKTGGALRLYNRAALAAAAILGLWRSATGRADATLAGAVRSSDEAPARMREVLRQSTHPSFPSGELLARFDQFYQESEQIVPAAALALARRDLGALGELARLSQAGAERGLGNQVKETTALVRLARELGAVAASAFGAGFGGSVWALVESSRSAAFREEWQKAYRRKFPAAGAGECFMTGAGPALLELS